jgi:two-component system KDP operon response regulator KdpE
MDEGHVLLLNIMQIRIVTALNVILTQVNSLLGQFVNKGQQLPKVLLFSRDRDLLNFLRLMFRFAGYPVSTAHNELSAQLILLVESPGLAVIHIHPPEPKSLDILRLIHGRSKIPILVLLDGSDPSGLESALGEGADDYLLTPFRPRELRARAEALIGRIQGWEEARLKATSPLVLREVALDARALRVIVAERRVKLSLVEFTLLDYLMANRESVGSRSEIIAQVWGSGFPEGDLLLDSTLVRLQKRIEPDPAHPRYLLQPE